jgi:hypothetical protein
MDNKHITTNKSTTLCLAPNNDLGIVFVGGCGGHWLGMVIQSLILDKYPLLRNNNYNFHNYSNYAVSHDIDLITNNNYIHFGTKYILHCYFMSIMKAVDNEYNNFHSYSNTALCLIKDTNPYIYNIDLEYSLIYTNPSEFASTLFDVMERYGAEFKRNYSFVNKCIDLYKKSNPSMTLFYDNWNSLAWLGCCHGVIDKLDIVLDINLIECNDIKIIQETLMPYRHICLNEVQKFIIPGSLDE